MPSCDGFAMIPKATQFVKTKIPLFNIIFYASTACVFVHFADTKYAPIFTLETPLLYNSHKPISAFFCLWASTEHPDTSH